MKKIYLLPILLLLSGCILDSDSDSGIDNLVALQTATAPAQIPAQINIKYLDGSETTRSIKNEAYYQNGIVAESRVFAYTSDVGSSGKAYTAKAIFDMTGQLQHVEFTNHHLGQSTPSETTKSTYTFDENGRVSETITYDTAGNPSKRYTFSYNEHGDKELEVHYNGSVEIKRIGYTLTYSGQELAKVEVDVDPDGDGDGDYFEYTWENGRLKKETSFDFSETKTRITEFSYNENKPVHMHIEEEGGADLYDIDITWQMTQVPLKVVKYIENLDIQALAGMETNPMIPLP